jgi:hypothetical protein
MRSAIRRGLLTLVIGALAPHPAGAGQSVRDVLAFLVTNRSIPTDDFDRDEEAAQATSEAIAGLLGIEIATLPIASSASGFIYRFDPTLGTVARLTDSFGPFFTERSMTVGRELGSFSLGYRSATFDTIDGRNLRDGTLVSTASILRGEAQPFDVETVSLRLHMDTVTAAGSYGITDRLEVGGAVPFLRLTLRGDRVDTYRGQEFPQASGTASASGLGDVVVRAKYNLLQQPNGGVAVAAEARLPTGAEEHLLGAGQASIKPRLLVSTERAPVAFDGEMGYSVGGLARALEYSGSLSVAATPRITVVGELLGRRLEGVGRLIETTQPHPRLIDVDTIRLTSVSEATNRLTLVAGFKWNVAGGWLLTANIVRPLTSAGLNAGWVPTIAVDYAVGQ